MRRELMPFINFDKRPFNMFQDFEKEVDRLFNDFHSRTIGVPQLSREASFVPSCDVQELEDQYLISFDVPGVAKEDIKIEVQDGLLTISGEKKLDRKEEKTNGHYSERQYGKFSRSFSLPKTVNVDNIEAHYENGVLDLRIPKAQAARPKQIAIQDGKGSFFQRIGLSKKSDKTDVEVEKGQEHVA